MKSTIQRISSEEDFIGVYDLFEGRKTLKELKWVFRDLDNKNSYNAFIAKTKENEIIGVIGYQTSTFTHDDKEWIGAIPFNWKISTKYKGIHGVMLFKKVLNYGDFIYSIGGSKTAVKLLPLFNLNQVSEYYKSYKLLNLINHNTSIKKIKLKERINLIEYVNSDLLQKQSKPILNRDVDFTEYKKKSLLLNEQEQVFEKKLTHNYINWLLKCPILDTYAFHIREENNYLGVCVLYINKFKNIHIGKIVYLPFLGNDVQIWLDVIASCLNFFKKNKCILVSAMGHHKMNQLALKKAGFIGNKLIKRGIYFNGVNTQMEPIDFNSWHIQFSEGDQAYLGHNL